MGAFAFAFAMAGDSVQAAPASGIDRVALARNLSTELKAYLKDRGVREHLSSLSLCVSLAKGEEPVTVTAGTGRYSGGVPVTPESLYQIGSNTKAFTAVAVLQLEAQGRLSIDAPIGTYLPQYPAYAKVTLRQMLRMNAGLPTYDDTPAWYRSYARDPMADVSSNSLVRLVYPAFGSAPGAAYAYSNTGYVLAEEIVAARSKSKSFATEIGRIIHEVGLKHTFYSSHLYPPPIARRVVAGYYENNDPGFGSLIGKNVTPYSLSWARGAGAIVSTPEDLTQWARALYEDSTLLPSKQRTELKGLISIKTARPIAKVTPADPAGFALGVTQRFAPGLGTFWFYQGETLGFRAAHLYFPSSGLVVALFANSRPTEENSRLQQLFGTLYATIESARKAALHN